MSTGGVAFLCSFSSRYEHAPKTFISDGGPPDAPLGTTYLPKGEEYSACDEDCPACDDYGFLSCSYRGRHRSGFVPYRKAWAIEKQMKAQGRCLVCGECL